MNLQEHFLLTALAEAKYKYNSLDIDHQTGCDFIDGKNVGLIFPRSLLNLCKSKWSDRKIKYFFKGTIIPKRNWLREYSTDGIIESSNRGRDINVKFTYDDKYYESLGGTKFALCPIGDCQWSYRFFEAIMCGAIPVLGDDDIDLFSNDFKYYRHSDTKRYYKKWAKHNLEILMEQNIL